MRWGDGLSCAEGREGTGQMKMKFEMIGRRILPQIFHRARAGSQRISECVGTSSSASCNAAWCLPASTCRERHQRGAPVARPEARGHVGRRRAGPAFQVPGCHRARPERRMQGVRVCVCFGGWQHLLVLLRQLLPAFLVFVCFAAVAPSSSSPMTDLGSLHSGTRASRSRCAGAATTAG
eukprot:SAG22_NODE_388_length_11295_cov_14.512594_8_plen_179_part_00